MHVIVPIAFFAMLGITGWTLYIVVKAMVIEKDGKILLDFNKYGEGWPELVAVAVIFGAGFVGLVLLAEGM